MIDALSLIENQTINVLDHGYVRLVDCMPRLLEPNETCDHAIVDAARVSYQAGTQRKSTDRGLIRTLMREQHTSPFEQVEFKFEIKLPIFVMRQLVRHRMASLNEESGRYSVLKDTFYIPTDLRGQHATNKQGSDSTRITELESKSAEAFLRDSADLAYNEYELMLEAGVAREQARMILPVNIYTSVVWKIDLHNLLRFLRLRMDGHAQYEIRVYADAMATFVEKLCPWTWQAFSDYTLESMTLSKQEIDVMRLVFGLSNIDINSLLASAKSSGLSTREIEGLSHKLNRLTNS